VDAGSPGDRRVVHARVVDDLKKFDVPTLILHGDADQIVPIGASAMLSSKLVKDSTRAGEGDGDRTAHTAD